MAIPKRVLIAITSATANLHDGKPTGMFISEALDPYNVFIEAGFEVDLASETGKYSVDWLSTTPDFLPDSLKTTWEDPNSAFRKKLDNMPDVSSIDPKKYGIFFASAGHAALIDYPHAKHLQKIATDIYARGGILSAVCHGEAIFPGVIDPMTGESVIKGKTITGFTTEGEEDMHLMDTIRSWKEPLIDEWAEKLGGKYVRDPTNVWADFHIVDGRIITGMNPQSAESTAKAVVKVFGQL